ncbi:reverse transcriptase domain-containing protein [Tanacetum coccineum]
MEIRSLAIFADSQLMVKQIKGLFEARQQTIKQYLQKVKEIMKGFDSYMIEHIRRNQNKKADALRKLASMTFEHLTKEVLVEVLAKKSIDDREVSKIEAKKGENWTTPIYEYLLSGLLPEDPKELSPSQAESVIKEIHEGSCGFNTKPRSMCQEQSMATKVSEKGAIVAETTWPFSHWGVNILGPLPTATGSLKFLSIAVEHSTKWVEAKPLTTTNGRQAKNFTCEHILRRTLPRNSQNETPFNLAYGSGAIVPSVEILTIEGKRGTTKENAKRNEHEEREVSSIEDAHYHNKLRRSSFETLREKQSGSQPSVQAMDCL